MSDAEFQQVLATHEEAIRKHIGGYMRRNSQARRAGADELWGEAMLLCWYACQNFDQKKGASLKTWILHNVKTGLRSYVRANTPRELPVADKEEEGERFSRVERGVPLDDTSELLEEASIRQWRTDARTEDIWAAINSLPDPLRQVVTWKVEGWSYEEIAAKLGVSDSTVHRHMTEARQHLRASLADLID